MAKKRAAVSSFSSAAAGGGFFLSLLCNPTSSHYPSSLGLILLTRRVDEGQPLASAGGSMPEITLSTSDLVCSDDLKWFQRQNDL
mmetsp:Transcript_5541/g.7741  ORF Transcript_5541/g.7741 Transcript_5541/m.7741 type:complete len:85 (-) Transcript_5541:150-404(-)